MSREWWRLEEVDNSDGATFIAEEVQNDCDMIVSNTFSAYRPRTFNGGKPHPDKVVETASLGSVPPPVITYRCHFPQDVCINGSLSSLQLETIAFVCQSHELDLINGPRMGFLVGDGAGVGKGRTLAGVIYENWILGRRRSLWISVSSDLRHDARRDLDDVGAKAIKLHSLNRLPYGPIESRLDGVIFLTYSALIGHSTQDGSYNTRLKQLLHWCGSSFDGVLIFDECHRAKNLCPVGMKKPTKTGLAVWDLQNMLPRARVVYASATGASEPRHMAYMTRLGIWGKGTPFQDFKSFHQAIRKRGVGAMELVAMDLKRRGAYTARQLSFLGVYFMTEIVNLDVEDVRLYNEAVVLWVNTMKAFEEAIRLRSWTLTAKQTVKIWGQFWGSHQRFFKYLCISFKVRRAIELSRVAVAEGNCVVIGLQSTGEATTTDELERLQDVELKAVVSSARGVYIKLIERHFPCPDVNAQLSGTQEAHEVSNPTKQLCAESGARPCASACALVEACSGNNKRQGYQRHVEDLRPLRDDESPTSKNKTDDCDRAGQEMIKERQERNFHLRQPVRTATDNLDVEKLRNMRTELMEKIDAIGNRLPPNCLDHLIQSLGGPGAVAEMTGRRNRLVPASELGIRYEPRVEPGNSVDALNVMEKDRFMNGDKLIAVISEAASSGISLHSDRRVRNQRRRVHISLELPWSADRAVQQFGRTHRSNQVIAPSYVFLISDLAGDHRFVSVVANRLLSLVRAIFISTSSVCLWIR